MRVAIAWVTRGYNVASGCHPAALPCCSSFQLTTPLCQVSLGFDVLISDLDVVWLSGRWQRWMTWADPHHPPVAEAALIASADVLVSTDELSISNDLRGARPRELNTGVLRFKSGPGALGAPYAHIYRERGYASPRGSNVEREPRPV